MALIVRDDVSKLGFGDWLAKNKIIACDCNLGKCAAATGVKYEEVKFTIENYKPRKASLEEANKTHEQKAAKWNQYSAAAKELKEYELDAEQHERYDEAAKKATDAKKELDKAQSDLDISAAAYREAKKSAAERKRSIWNDGWGDFDGFRRRLRRRILLKKKAKRPEQKQPPQPSVYEEYPPAYCDIDDDIDDDDGF